MVELSLELGVVVIAWLVSLFIAIFAVPRLVAPKAREAWTNWLMSEESEPYMDRVAERVMVKMEPRLTGFEERLAAPVELNLDPIVSLVVEGVIPRVKEEVDKVRQSVDGHLGFLKKVGNQAGEAVAEIVGHETLSRAGVDPAQAVLKKRLGALLKDEAWVKAHPAGAIGLEILAAYESGDVTLQRGGGGFRRSLRRR